MKGGGGGGGGTGGVGISYYSLPGKGRRWRGLAVAVLCLVILSMLVPLVFLLGFHSTGFVAEDPSSTARFNPSEDNASPTNQSSQEGSSQDVKLTHAKDFTEQLIQGNKTISTERKHGQPGTHGVMPKSPPFTKKNISTVPVEVTEHVKGATSDEIKKSCQLEFGSYCLWYQEHKEEMKDKVVKKMKDHLFVARAYYPSVAKMPTQDKLSRDMKQNIQEFERIFSEATTDADLPPHTRQKIEKMEAVIAKAKSVTMDCNNVDKKLRQLLDLTEDEAHFHMKQSAYLYQLVVETMPKSLHCLSLRLTVEYFKSDPLELELMPSDKHLNPELHHYVIFSNNILASSVVINSTVMHSKESENQVFHVLTDEENYFAMKLWFSRNSYRDASVQVLNIEDINVEYRGNPTPLHLSSEEFRVSLRDVNEPSGTQMKTEYISLFGHTHFHLPEILQKLHKVVVLDHDVVVQRDLTPLWSLEMGENVIGAVQFCGVKLNQLKSYLGEKDYDGSTCTWMSGLNIIDLVAWRKQNLTETYSKLLQVQSTRQTSIRDGALPANLLTFQGLVYSLDSSWALSGLGHDYGIDGQAIKEAAVLHYNGNMKPWLELGIPRYKTYWKRYLKQGDEFMSACNVNP